MFLCGDVKREWEVRFWKSENRCRANIIYERLKLCELVVFKLQFVRRTLLEELIEAWVVIEMFFVNRRQTLQRPRKDHRSAFVVVLVPPRKYLVFVMPISSNPSLITSTRNSTLSLNNLNFLIFRVTPSSPKAVTICSTCWMSASVY